MRARITWLAALALLCGAGPLAAVPARGGAEELCGNGILDGDEQCDDGNLLNGDGCDGRCLVRFCLDPPPPDCITTRKAKLSARHKVTETKNVGSFSVSLAGFSEPVAQADFGDPVFDTTRYDLCVYNQNERLVTQLIVDRGFAMCGEANRACWKGVRDRGYRYRDPELLAAGIASIELLAGDEGRGKVTLAARRTKKSQRLPHIARPLEGNSRATVRLMIENGRCIEGSLDVVKVAEESRFRAASAPPASAP